MIKFGESNKAAHMESLMILENAPFEVYQTGSQFFGLATVESDADFYTQESAEVEIYLEESGFKLLSKSIYADSNTIAVYNKAGVDVQLEKDVTKKRAIHEAFQRLTPDKQNYVRDIFSKMRYGKFAVQAVWELLYLVVEEGKASR